jgi:hypothetical protein
MSDAERPLWEKEESVEAKASPDFAYRWWANIENEQSFATSLVDGMRAVRDRIDKAASDQERER